MEGNGRPPPRPSSPHWISATFTTTIFGRQPQDLVIQDDTERLRQAWLTSSHYTPVLVSCLPDICTLVWVHRYRLCQVTDGSWPTPPQSPERALKDAEDGISRLLLAAASSDSGGQEQDECDRSFRDFLADVAHRLRLRGCHLIVALILLERLRNGRHIGDHPTSLTAKCGAQAYIFCLLLAHKISEDRAYDNKTWAHLTRYSVDDINRMERRMLGLLEHRLFVGEGDLRDAFDRVAERYHLMDQNVPPRRSSRGL